MGCGASTIVVRPPPPGEEEHVVPNGITCGIYGVDLPDKTVVIEENATTNNNNNGCYKPPQTHNNVSFVTQHQIVLEAQVSPSAPSIPTETEYDTLTEKQLNEFIVLDREIQELESGHTEEVLLLHQSEYANIEQEIKCKEIELGELDNSENSTSPSKCMVYMQRVAHQDEGNSMLQGSEHTETLSIAKLKNKREVCEMQLFSLREKLNQVTEAVQKASEASSELVDKRLKLSGLLENVFTGDYGSDLENHLELKADQLLQQKQNVSVSHFKWWNARHLINHALTQMGVVCKRWREINQLPNYNMTGKYALVTVARDNLVAAEQNCLRAEEYLKIAMPYWSMREKENIRNSIHMIYGGLNSSVEYQKAYAWYYYYHQQLGMQLNWMDQVINNKIVTDYKQLSRDFKEAYTQLKIERLKLMKTKAKELNIQWDIEPYLNSLETNLNQDDTETETLPSVPIMDTNVSSTVEGNIDPTSFDDSDTVIEPPEPDTVENPEPDTIPSLEPDPPEPGTVKPNQSGTSGMDLESITTSEQIFEDPDSNVSFTGPPPIVKRLSLSELAPVPSNNELFGNMKQLEEMHRKQMSDFEQIQETNRARQQEGLKEKLRRRQSKRRKLMSEETQ